MNKKFIALLVPLMLLPMVGFAAAHWYDYIYKQYKLKAGCVCVEVTKWHVLGTTSYDVDCDGIVFGDELQITNLWGTNPCDDVKKVVGVQILANPIFPCWELTLEMFVYNKGTLAVKMDIPKINFSGPLKDEPDWTPIQGGSIPDYFQYWTKAYIWKEDIGEWVQVQPTTFVLKPCEEVKIVQYIHFIGQEHPELQCHWFRLDVLYPFFQYVPEGPLSSYTWPVVTQGPS
ncbi:MAG: hypothetical protein QHH18_07435 [Candidatus Bathyarchaeota archaeon]|jgi:hypothetical protein|nr:hypothetical protein [Candidatus Bathyarchaeota archaeon A05DMB-5]MDH7558414.1 hypothetical protein [Candidatus Bathyarchaeota archaeon]